MNSSLGAPLLSPDQCMSASAVIGNIVVNGAGIIEGGVQALHSISVRRRGGVVYDNLQPGAQIRAVIAGSSALVTLGHRIKYTVREEELNAFRAERARFSRDARPKSEVEVEVLVDSKDKRWVSADQIKPASQSRATVPMYTAGASKHRVAYPPLRVVSRAASSRATVLA